jgi:Tfp pilus assembly protein PilP
MNFHFLPVFPFLLLVAGCFGQRASEEKNVEQHVDQVRIAAGKQLEKSKN